VDTLDYLGGKEELVEGIIRIMVQEMIIMTTCHEHLQDLEGLEVVELCSRQEVYITQVEAEVIPGVV